MFSAKWYRNKNHITGGHSSHLQMGQLVNSFLIAGDYSIETSGQEKSAYLAFSRTGDLTSDSRFEYRNNNPSINDWPSHFMSSKLFFFS